MHLWAADTVYGLLNTSANRAYTTNRVVGPCAAFTPTPALHAAAAGHSDALPLGLRRDLRPAATRAPKLFPLGARATLHRPETFGWAQAGLAWQKWSEHRAYAASATRTEGVVANGDIPFPRVRVVDDAGLVGDFMLSEARALAYQRGTDLVVLSGAVDPPLCRLVALETYVQELDSRAAAKTDRMRERKLREFSFDPAMKIKGMRFTAMVDEHDLERKVNQVRQFLEKGHRVELRVLQGRCPPEDVLDLALRIIAEVRDIAKPEHLEESIRELRVAINSPKSLKRAGKAPPDELRIRLWPCTPEQAAAFAVPAHIVGPRRRRGPAIVGIDDGEQPEDMWKDNRKPGSRKQGVTKGDLVDSEH